MNSFKDRALGPEIGAGNQAKSAYKCAAEIAENIPVKILCQEDVVLIRIHHQLHARVVHDVLFVLDLRKALGDNTAAAQKQSIR